jgi:signal transduction histidine kinase
MPTTLELKAPEDRLPPWGRVAILVLGLALVSWLHYNTTAAYPELHVLYQRLYYVPIVVGAYWFGIRGGLATAIAAAAAYAPHIHMMWGGNAPFAASQYAELVAFQAAGVLVGLLADQQRRMLRRYQVAATSLESANQALRESYEQLRHAERLSVLGEIAADLAHEIRNPLASIKGALDIITTRVAPDTPEAEFSSIATKELSRLDELVGEFLTYARPHAPELRLGDLHEIIEHVVLLLRPQADRAGVALVRDGLDRLPLVLIDSEQIRQVLVNVILNGIQASARGSELVIRTSLDDEWAVVEVIDRGTGIPAEALDKVCEPFFTTKPGGTGLGLAISEGIISAHQGKLEFSSTPGAGTLVRVALRRPGSREPAQSRESR